MHARDDEKEVLLTWELLHVRGEGKKGRHLRTISISIIISISIRFQSQVDLTSIVNSIYNSIAASYLCCVPA